MIYEQIAATGTDLFGRADITTPAETVTRDNVVNLLSKARVIHNFNRSQIEYLCRYVGGNTPILHRTKVVRPEILNKVHEGHALEFSEFTSSYFASEPITYVRRGDKKNNSKDIECLNNYMFFEDKSAHDMTLASWMAICGVGYRMVLPDRYVTPDDIDESPFEIDVLDPRNTFVVYNSGFGKRPLMGVYITKRLNARGIEEEYADVYTADRYFQIKGDQIVSERMHDLGDIPIIEYSLNMYKMGAFEPAIPIFDAIDKITSDRCDAVEQHVQSYLKFKNCDIDEESIKRLRNMGAISVKSVSGLDADVDTISEELNQSQVQTLVDYLLHQAHTICGIPDIQDTSGGSTSDNGVAVVLRNGWMHAESRARETEQMFKRAEKRFLKIVLRIMRDTRDVNISLSEIECKFTRRQHDNLLTKTQSLLHMLEAGLAPEVAIATCGLFNDPVDVVQQSEDYLGKWVYEPTTPEESASGNFQGLSRNLKTLNDGKQDTDEILDKGQNAQVSEKTDVTK